MAAHAQVAQSPLYQAAQQQAADLREQLAAQQRERLDLDLKLADAQHRMHVQDRQVHLPKGIVLSLCPRRALWTSLCITSNALYMLGVDTCKATRTQESPRL